MKDDHEDRLSGVTAMQPGDHCCGIYENEEEHRHLVSTFVLQGIERGEKIYYIVDAHTAAELTERLEADGVDVDALAEKGQFSFLTVKDAYLKDGEFDPDKMIALLREETQQALDEGYPALRVTGEMTWALSGEPGSDRIIEYEAKLNDFFPGTSCYAICQYDRRRFDPELLTDVLQTHPKVMLDTTVYDNARRYFVPAAGFLSDNRPRAIVDRWIANLRETPSS